MVTAILSALALIKFTFENRAIRLTQCCTQFRSLGVKVLPVFQHSHSNDIEIPVINCFFFLFVLFFLFLFPKGFELGAILSLPHLSMVESIAYKNDKNKTKKKKKKQCDAYLNYLF